MSQVPEVSLVPLVVGLQVLSLWCGEAVLCFRLGNTQVLQLLDSHLDQLLQVLVEHVVLHYLKSDVL